MREIPFRSVREQAHVFAASTILLFIAAHIDGLLGPQASVLLFYMASIALVVWFIDARIGYCWALLTALLRFNIHRFDPYFSGHWHLLYWNLGIEVFSLLGLVLILDGLHRQIANEAGLARTDPLTKVHNRRSFLEHAGMEMERSRRYGHPISVVYIDVDNFKIINDSFGHKAGDALLQSVAENIASNVRRADIVARVGGDEFALLMPETTAGGAERALERLLEKLRAGLSAQ